MARARAADAYSKESCTHHNAVTTTAIGVDSMITKKTTSDQPSSAIMPRK